jgi:hypothetical protein
MKPLVKPFAVAGLLVPSVLLVANLIELELNLNEVPMTHSLWPYVWPSSIFLSAAHPIYEFGIIDWLIMGVAIGMNMVFYALIGLMVIPIWARITKSSSERK